MKTIRFFFTLALFAASTSLTLAQTITETFAVSGNCGMCKNRIEKAAKGAGAAEATWNKDTKELTVSFAAGATSVAKIQQKVAEVGHDNASFQATDATYAKLPPCCKYERAAAAAAPAAGSCCQKGEGGKEGKCGKDDKCSKDDKGDKKGCCDKDEKSCKDKKGASCAEGKNTKGGSCCSKKS